MKRAFIYKWRLGNKKYGSILPLCLLAVVISYVFLTFLLDDPAGRPKLPTESRQHKAVLTSNGCCFVVKDINLRINTQENQLFLASAAQLTEQDILEYGLPDMAGENIKVSLSFTVFYGEDISFNQDILEMDADKLRENGLLLYFQEHDDMYLNVVSGGMHITYKLGDEDDRWCITDVPNTIYE